MQCLLNHRTNFDKRNKFMVHKIKLSKVIHYRIYIYTKNTPMATVVIIAARLYKDVIDDL